MPKRIDHVAIIVRNIEQALVFYRDTLGIEPSEVKEVPTEQVRIAFLPMGGPGGSEIELIEPTTPDSSLSKFLDKRGEGMHHICLEVEDINAALQEMQEKGAAVLDKLAAYCCRGTRHLPSSKGHEWCVVGVAGETLMGTRAPARGTPLPYHEMTHGDVACMGGAFPLRAPLFRL